MKSISYGTLGASLSLLALFASAPAAAETVHAKLKGYSEVPAVSTAGTGAFRARVDRRAEMIDYELSYENLQGTPFQAHIHFGQKDVNGGISLWLCGQAPATPPAGTPACPPSGMVSGTLAATNVVGPNAQLIAPGEMAEIIAAIRAGVAYVNVHTNLVPSGEIRGQID